MSLQGWGENLVEFEQYMNSCILTRGNLGLASFELEMTLEPENVDVARQIHPLMMLQICCFMFYLKNKIVVKSLENHAIKVHSMLMR